MQLAVFGASGIQDLAGNPLDGDADGRPGADYSIIVGLGRRFSYLDSNGDTVTLTLTGGGMMELTRRPDGEGQDLYLLNTNPLQSIVSGTVKKSKKVPSADGLTHLRAITGLAALKQNRLPATFIVDSSSLSAAIVDRLLERGELRAGSWPK